MTASNLDAALSLADRGWRVFPCDPDRGSENWKKPLNSTGFQGAGSKPRAIEMMWRRRPEALVGVAMADKTVALDVDLVEEFTAAGLELPDAPEQQTPSGGYHRFYRTDGRTVRQTVKEVPGADTRVGGKGYVIAWNPDAFPRPEDLPNAPEWLYDGQSESKRVADAEADADLLIGEDGATHRDQLVTYAGRLRWAGSTTKEILAALKEARADGRIVDGDETRPWTEADFKQIAKDLGSKPGPEKAPVIQIHMSPHKQPDVPVPAEDNAVDLLAMDLRELEYPINEILPEGLGVVAGAPKVGKSWLTFQAAVELAIGGELLGHQCEQRDVLYYGLEDGQRRFQKRLKTLVGGRKIDLSRLTLRYESPRLTKGLEPHIEAWLDAHPGGIVFIDVLAKIRPPSTGKANAYDEDYGVVGPLQTISRNRPGTAIVVVTHDRKAGSEDFLTTVTGTRGITGAADWIWVVKRDRLQPDGTIYVTGRDIERDAAVAAVFDGPWSVSTTGGPGGKGPKQRAVWEVMRTDGPIDAAGITERLHPDLEVGTREFKNASNTIWKSAEKLHEAGYAEKDQGDGVRVLYTARSWEEAVIPGLPRVRMRPHASADATVSADAEARAHAEMGVQNVQNEQNDRNVMHTLHTPLARTPARAPAHTRGSLR